MKSFSATVQAQNPPPQLTIEEAIQAAGRAASKDWYDLALRITKNVCMEHESFTTDTIRERLDKFDAHTKNMSSLGAVMREAASNGWCVLANEWVQSDRPEAHRRAVRVWQSRIYSLPHF